MNFLKSEKCSKSFLNKKLEKINKFGDCDNALLIYGAPKSSTVYRPSARVSKITFGSIFKTSLI